MRWIAGAPIAIAIGLGACGGSTVHLGDDPSGCQGTGPCAEEEDLCPEYRLNQDFCGSSFDLTDPERARELAASLRGARELAATAHAMTFEVMAACTAILLRSTSASTVFESELDELVGRCQKAARSLPGGLSVRYQETLSVCIHPSCGSRESLCLLSVAQVTEVEGAPPDLSPLLEKWLPPILQAATDEGRVRALSTATDDATQLVKRLGQQTSPHAASCTALALHDLTATSLDLARAREAASLLVLPIAIH